MELTDSLRWRLAVYRHLFLPLLLLGFPHLAPAQTVKPAPRTNGANSTGFTAGLDGWPADLYCSGLANAAMQTLPPNALLRRLQLAAQCGVRLVIVPPRRMITSNGLAKGPFSLESAKQLTDQYAQILTPETIQEYRSNIVGLNLADDYTCVKCWGGEKITQQQIADWAAYARTRLPGLPLGVRVTPDWVKRYPPLAPLLDYTWAQYHTRKGDPKEFYDKAAGIARQLGLKVVMGVNVRDCYGENTMACSGRELAQFGAMAMSHPASCAFINWRYDEATWEQPDVRQAWAELMALARKRPAVECSRGH
jgi:hypothetical protein